MNDARNHLTPNQRAWQRFRRNRAAVAGGWWLLIFVALALLWPWLSPYRPDSIGEAQFAAPSLRHWFGTDVHGRDVLARVLYGARISLVVGAVGAGVSLVIGVLWGGLAGYLGGRWDGVLMRVVDVLYALP